MTTSELARKAGQTKSPAKAAAAARNGRAGRQSMHPAVVAAREWAGKNLRSHERTGSVIVLPSGRVAGLCGDSGSPLANYGCGAHSVPVAGGQVLRCNGEGHWVQIRVQCGPLAKEAPAPCAHISPGYLRDLARQAPEFRDAWKMDEVGRALVNAADRIDRLQRQA